jgi:hypothetical protein
MGENPGHFGTIRIGLIGGGDITDPASDQSCNQKVFLPMEHSPDGVKLEHLAFSPLHRSPDRDTQQSFPGVHDPGSLVYCMKIPGSNQVLILGQANDLFNSEPKAGNMDLLNNPLVKGLFERTIKIRTPPNIEEKELEDGTKVRTMKEKDKEWSHSLTKGLPTHASLFPIVGFFNPEVKDVPTAKQHFSDIQTKDMMDKMPGDVMSLGKMLKGLMGGGGSGGGGGGGGGGGSGGGGGGGSGSSATSNVSPTISGLSPQLQNAVLSASYLIQDFEGTSGSTTLVLGDRVHTNTYMENANSLISQITCVDDLMTCLHRLRWDTSLFGQENLTPAEFTIDTAWGTAIQTMGVDGTLTVSYGNNAANVAQTQSNFANTMSDPAQSPSTAGGQNMFGGSAGTMMDMFKRMAPVAEKAAKKMTEKLNTSDKAKKLQKIIDKTVQGGNPLDPELFK